MLIKKKNVFCNICTIILIYATDTFIVFSNVDERIKTIFQCLQLLMFVAFFIYLKGRIKINRNVLYQYFLMIFSIILCMIFNHDFSTANIYKIMQLTIGMIFCVYFFSKEWIYAFIKIMTIICFFSILAYVFQILIPVIVKYFPILKNGSNVSVVTLGITNIPIREQGLPRNWGPFWEPGVYSIYLSLALYLSLKKNSKVKKECIILIIGIISTLSTTGLVLLGLIFLDFLTTKIRTIEEGAVFKRKYKLVSVIIVVILLVIIILNEKIQTILFGKFDVNNYSFISTMSRIGSITGNLKILSENLFFGVGATNIDALFKEYMQSNGFIVTTNTNGLLMNFSIYGLVFGITYLCRLIFSSKAITGHKNGRCYLILLILASLFSEPLILSLLFNTIIFLDARCEEKCQ